MNGNSNLCIKKSINKFYKKNRYVVWFDIWNYLVVIKMPFIMTTDLSESTQKVVTSVLSLIPVWSQGSAITH